MKRCNVKITAEKIFNELFHPEFKLKDGRTSLLSEVFLFHFTHLLEKYNHFVVKSQQAVPEKKGI